MTDSEIFEGLQSDDQLFQSRTVGVLLGQIKDPLIHFVKQNSGSREEGVEMANETVVTLWKAIGEGKYQVRPDTKLSTWCVSVGRNLWLKELRGRRGRGDNLNGGEGNEPSDPDTPLDIITAVEDHKLASDDMQRAWRAFKKLSPECQQLFRSDLDDTPDEEIMHELGMENAGSVKVKRHRCKKKWIALYQQENSKVPDGTPA